jgi:type I restriction enzyme S subunit
MKKYQSYKLSGNEFIGEIPEHWEPIRLGMLGVFSSSGIDKKIVEDEPIVRMVNYTDIIKSRIHNPIIDKSVEFMLVSTPTSKLNEHKLNKGDLVFLPSSETCEDLGVSSLIDFDEDDVVFSYHILRFQFNREINHYFKKYLGNYHSVLCQFSSEGKGTTRQIIGRNVFRNVWVVIPPLSEQIQIVQFLDEKTELIDRLISTKERKIDLLKQQRTSLINEVITKGLNPNVKMKDSGVEWIGDIPEHWEMKRVSNFGTFFKGSGIKKDEVKEFGLPCIRYGEIYTKYERVVYEPLSFIDEETSKSSISIKKGDLLFTGSGETIEDIGKSILYYGEKEVYVGGDIIILRLTGGINPLFISYLMTTKYIQYQKSLFGRGEIIVHIYSKNIKEIKTPLPPINEQEQIVEYLDTRTKEIEDLVSMEKNKIDLLKEYRQSLISEVITGKIDVRTNLN